MLLLYLVLDARVFRLMLSALSSTHTLYLCIDDIFQYFDLNFTWIYEGTQTVPTSLQPHESLSPPFLNDLNPVTAKNVWDT